MSTNSADTCVEDGQWTPVPVDPPTALKDFTLPFSEVDASENERMRTSGVMSFHMVGCAGDFSHHKHQQRVADAMASQVDSPGDAGIRNEPATNVSFFFHLSDVVYKPDEDDKKTADKKATNKEPSNQKQMYNDQFSCLTIAIVAPSSRSRATMTVKIRHKMTARRSITSCSTSVPR